MAEEAAKVHIFWDNSNIFIAGQAVAEAKDPYIDKRALRINFNGLFNLARAGRIVGGGLAAGSVPPEYQDMWTRFRDATPSLKFELQERGALTGKEQGVDHALQVAMLRATLDHEVPQIAVLLTGDGKGYVDGVGFHADLERMHKKGWGIEVLAWDMACNNRLREWARTNGVYVPLDTYFDAVTFLEGGRAVKPLNLTGRPKSAPKIVEPVLKLDPKKERARKRALKLSRLASEAANKKKTKHHR